MKVESMKETNGGLLKSCSYLFIRGIVQSSKTLPSTTYISCQTFQEKIPMNKYSLIYVIYIAVYTNKMVNHFLHNLSLVDFSARGHLNHDTTCKI